MPVSFDSLEEGKKYTRPELAEIWGYSRYEAISSGIVTPWELKGFLLELGNLTVWGFLLL